MRYHIIDPVIQSADLQADYETLWTEQAGEQDRLARLNAELNNEAEIGRSAAPPGPVPRQLASDLVNNETQQLSLWNANNNKEIVFLNRAVNNATDQLAELTEQRGKEKEGVEADSAELQRLTMFKEQGNVTSNRVVDARRAMLLSSTRLLQTEGQITQITREKEDYVRRIERLNDESKLAILKDIQASQIKLATINARISATADKLAYTTTMRSQLPLSRAGSPTVLIVRGTNETLKRIDAAEDTPLEPGDVVEISLVPKSNMAENR
jgi:polysaccharide export outer membrane protein